MSKFAALPFDPESAVRADRRWALNLAAMQQMDIADTVKLAAEYLDWKDKAAVGKDAAEVAARHPDRQLAKCLKRLVAYAKFLSGATQD